MPVLTKTPVTQCSASYSVVYVSPKACSHSLVYKGDRRSFSLNIPSKLHDYGRWYAPAWSESLEKACAACAEMPAQHVLHSERRLVDFCM